MTALLDAINAEIRDREEQARRLEDQLRQVGGQLDKLAQLHHLAQGLEAGEAPDRGGELTPPSPPRAGAAASNGGGPGASPASKPARPRSKPRPAPQRAGAAAPKPKTKASGAARRQAVLDAIRHGSASRSAIADATGITPSAILDLIRPLVAEGLVKPEGQGAGRRYRAARNGASVRRGPAASGQGPSLQGRVLEAVIYRPRPAAELARALQEPQAAVEEELARLEADGDIICRPDRTFAPTIGGGV